MNKFKFQTNPNWNLVLEIWHFEIPASAGISVGRAAPKLRGNLRYRTCGESRIRTCEDVVSRFTVCPRWPLEYLPFVNYELQL